MTQQQRILKIASTALLVLGMLSVILGLMFCITSSVELTQMGEAIDETSEDYQYALDMGAVGVDFFITGALIALTGIFGRRSARQPRKVLGLIITSSFLTFVCVIDVFISMAELQIGWALLMQTVLLAASVTILLIAANFRKHKQDIPENELPGPDGNEFEEGFNPKHLGFMRVIQVLCAINIAVTIAWLTTLIKGSYVLEFSQLLDLANLIFDGVLFWLIWQRSSATKPFALVFTVFNITIGSVFNMATGNFNILRQISLSASDIMIFCYFLFSRRAEAILNRPFSLELVKERADDEATKIFNLKSWSFWRSAIIYFCVFSVVGHWMEAGFCTLIKWGIVPGTYDPTSQIWSDWLYPFPVYGFGTLACILVLFPIKNALRKRFPSKWKPLVFSFVINTLICTAIELALGLLQNQPVDGVYPLWDYSNMFCNFMGQVCLQNSLAFGLVATLMTWVVYPALEKLMHRLPESMANVLFIVVVNFFAILSALYIIKIAV